MLCTCVAAGGSNNVGRLLRTPGGRGAAQRCRVAMPSGAPEGPGRDGWKAWATEVTFDVLLALGMLSKTNARWLRAKKRKKWWKRGDFPLVPKDSLAAEKRKAGEMELEVLWKVVPLGILFFCASFNLTLLQNMRDALIVTSGGAEQLPFLAAYCVLPCSIAFFVYYNRLRDSVRPERVFYAAIAPLLTAYVLFATVLYPAADALHFNHLSDVMRAALPAGLHGLVGVVTNWTYSLFFCLAELWGTVVISLLFWGIANEVCTVSEAKSVYPLLGIAANLALVVLPSGYAPSMPFLIILAVLTLRPHGLLGVARA